MDMTGKATRSTAWVSTVVFVATFAAVRGLTYSIHVGIGLFHDVSTGGTHIHHMVWGILLLLAAGYVRLLHDGSGARKSWAWTIWLTAVAYGAGAALTLDEFALWLCMRDVYWQRLGWESIGAGVVFAGVLLVAVWGRQLGRAAVRKLMGSQARVRRSGRVAAAGE